MAIHLVSSCTAAGRAAFAFAIFSFFASLSANTIPISYPSLYPESFAWDDQHGHFIAGSVMLGALFTFSDDGIVHEFLKDAQYAGKAAILGLVLDETRRRVLVVVSNIFNSSSAFDALAAYDLETRERIFLARLDKDGLKSGANDVTVDPLGNAYVTNSNANFVWKVTPEGEVSLFAQSLLLTSQTVTAVDLPAVRCGLNGVVVVRNTMLLVTETKSGKLFTVGLNDRIVKVVNIEQPLIAADGLAMRKDGTLVVVSTDFVRLVKSHDGWKSAHIIDEVRLDRSLNATTVALRRDRTFVIHTHFQDLWTYLLEGPDALPGGLRKEFSVQEIHFQIDSDNNPLWLLVIPVMFLVLLAVWKIQMSRFFQQYNRKKRA